MNDGNKRDHFENAGKHEPNMVSLYLLRILRQEGKLCPTLASWAREVHVSSIPTLLPPLAQKSLPRKGRVPPLTPPPWWSGEVRRGGWLGSACRLWAICFFKSLGWETGVWSLAGSWGRMALFPPKLQTAEGQCVSFQYHPSDPEAIGRGLCGLCDE